MSDITIAGPLPPFIPELRQAIREGIKTQTRRVVKEDIPADFTPYQYDDLMGAWGVLFSDPNDKQRYAYVKCPYGAPGQIRYLREPLTRNNHGFAVYLDDSMPVRDNDGRMVKWRWKVSTLSSLFMPAEYARTFVKVARIHVERVKDISAQDALSEGVSDQVLMPSDIDTGSALFHATAQRQIIDKFFFLWNKINAARGYPVDSNPPVWVLNFNQIRLP